MLLVRDENDFFAKENYFMVVSTLKLTSTFFTLLVGANFTSNAYERFSPASDERQEFIDDNTINEQDLRFIYFLFQPIDQLCWWFILYHGTSPK